MKANKVLSLLLTAAMLLAVLPLGVWAEGDMCAEAHHFSDSICIYCDSLLGDIDGDGSITSSDYATMKRIINGTYIASDDLLPFADLDVNGKIDFVDYGYLKGIWLGLIDEVPASNAVVSVHVNVSVSDTSANELFPYEGSKITSVTYFGADTIEMFQHYNHYELNELNLEYGVSAIGDAAFMLCSDLREVVIPASVTEMGAYVFAKCYNLKDIYVYAPQGLDSWNENWAGDCNATVHYISCEQHDLKEYIYAPTCTENGESIISCRFCGYESSINELAALGHTYTDSSKCQACGMNKDPNYEYIIANQAICINKYIGTDQDVVIPDTISGYPVTSIGYRAFYSNDTLTSVVIPQGVTTIGDSAFEWCRKLTSVTLPESVASIGANTFNYCYSLENINLPAGLTHIGDAAFRSCEKITSIVLPESLTAIGEMAFYWCEKLESISIPENLTTIGDYAFSGCYAMKTVTIPVTVQYLGNRAFSACETIYCEMDTAPAGWHEKWHAGSANIYMNGKFVRGVSGDFAFNALSGEAEILAYVGEKGNDSSSTYEVVIPNEIEGYLVTSIGNAAFSEDYYMSSISIPDSVTHIGDDAFWECHLLKNINIPKNLEYIGEFAFAGCFGFPNVTLPDTLTYIGSHAFQECWGMSEITIPASVITIDEYAFVGCEELTDIRCEAESKPESWADNWANGCSATVHWGYKPPVAHGDANGDGEINGADVTNLLTLLANMSSDTELPDGADCNGDGVIDGRDAVRLLRYLAYLDPVTGESSVKLG